MRIITIRNYLSMKVCSVENDLQMWNKQKAQTRSSFA